MSLPAGTRLGSYEVLELIGSGGMGEVYRARDRKLGREVAIKVLPEEFARDDNRVARFEREARMLAAVNHAAIAAIYGAEEDGATRYIVMELVEGDTLAERLMEGKLPVADALRVAAQVAEALEVAHEKGVIHRDLKPANIKLTPENKVKVLDFGLAKAMEIPYSGDMSKTPTVVMDDSRPGDIVGTPEFMSPEQARGKETDKRTDIWAFGCLLFEMLSGKRAFTGETVPDALAAILHHDPDWSVLPARVPERVRELLRRCLEKDVGRRLRDAGDARLELESAMLEASGVVPGPRAASPAGRRLGLALVVAAALALGIFLVFRRPGPAPVAAGIRQLAVLPFRNLTGTAAGDLMGLAMVDTVSARLSNVPGLQVVTPRAAIEASDQDSNPARVARRLGASTLLSGSVQRENERYRISYWLTDANGKQIGADTIDGSEIFPLQDRIAAGVVRDLRLPPGARRTPTPSGLDTVSEQERYLEAIGLLQRYDKQDGVARALQILQKLAEEKPVSALVQAALARACLALYDFTKEPALAQRAIAATHAARALDAGLPEVDLTEGYTLLATGRYEDAVAVFERAVAANPGQIEALSGLGKAQSRIGRREEAEAALLKAVALQRTFATENQLGAFYADGGEWAKATEQFRKTVQLWPDSPRALGNLGGVLMSACDAAGAVEVFRTARKLSPKDPYVASNLGMTQLWSGHAADAVASLESAAKELPNDYQIRGNLADALRDSGQEEKARESYDRAVTLAREQLRVNPRDASAFSAVATGLARTGRVADARAPMLEALAIDSADANILSDAACVAALAGRKEEALGLLRRALAAGYCRSTIARQPDFNSLRDDAEFRSIVAAPRPAAGP
jgi:Flp pilus assembly protein TadD/TolB-like protein/predicted Ser/Thr protein kinase